MSIDLAIQNKLSLGQLPDEDFFQSFSSDSKIYIHRWMELTSFEFLQIKDSRELLEVQGHHPDFIDTIFLKYKTPIHCKINLLEWHNLLNYLCLKEQIAWNTTNPFVSFTSIILDRPCRVTLIHDSLTCKTSKTNAKFFIRFHLLDTLPLKYFIAEKDQNQLSVKLNHMIVVEKKNVLICGATGSGKTTLLKSLSQFIPTEDHLITLEDTEELFIKRERITSLLAQANPVQHATNEHLTTMDKLCSYTLRLTPERLIIGEIRGKEILTLSMMLNTGHQGLLTTVHASSAVNAIQRLAMLFCLYQQDGSSFTYSSTLKFLTQQFHRVIFIEDKIIKEVIHIIGADQDNIFYDTLYQIEN